MSSVSPDQLAYPPLTVLDGADLRRWVFRAEAALKRRRRSIDALNVFPVPDGDTGTNLYLTLHAALEGLLDGYLIGVPAGVADATEALTHHLLLSARGNSGVILSQLFRGMADAVVAESAGDSAVLIDGPLMARMMRSAADTARRAVSEPTEGTILTVADAAADEAEAAADAGGSLAAVTDAALRAAETALARTPTQLAPLARAGVVDAGGAGLVVLIEALHEVVTGRRGEAPAEGPAYWWVGERPAAEDPPLPGATGSGDYEVMYLLEGCSDAGAATLRDQLQELGDSVLVAGDPRLRTVHVHLDDAGAAIEHALGHGRVSAIRISWLGGSGLAGAGTGLGSGVTSNVCASEAGASGPGATHAGATHIGASEPGASTAGVVPDADLVSGTAAGPGSRLGAVACAPGPGVAASFAQAGARVVSSHSGRRATPGQILEAITATVSPSVVVFPNDGDTLLAAQSAARLAVADGVDVHLVQTISPIQGMAALAVFDPIRSVVDNLRGMTEAATVVRCGRVAVATRAAATDAGPCRPGDVLGFVGDAVVTIGDEPVTVTLQLLEHLGVADAELVTLVSGTDSPGLAELVAELIAQRWPAVEVTTVDGGQPVDSLLVGVE